MTHLEFRNLLQAEYTMCCTECYLSLNCVGSRGKIWEECEMGGDFSTGGCDAFVLVRVIMKREDHFVYLL